MWQKARVKGERQCHLDGWARSCAKHEPALVEDDYALMYLVIQKMVRSLALGIGGAGYAGGY